MKKLIIFLFVISVIVLNMNHSENIHIPKNSIRYRIVGNSNSENDQKLKWEINKDIIPIITEITKNSSTIEETRTNIKSSINKINYEVKKFTNDYNVSFKNNYFPKKVYKDVIYDEGYYESLVITLGDGLGENWWCVLFPPLCLIESNSNIDDITYDFYFKNIINKYL